ncbi:HIT domain-containing protein [Streptomyces sp. NPDC048442]|uniref:HIT family protein n=1 Tax=Streptomyces sp. NPDC048442 TaxID=3154823 RepID=UPI0034320B5F
MTTVAGATTVSDFYCHQALAGLVPIDVVEETENVLAFRHTRPAYPVHIVVIPKTHIPSLTDLGNGGAGLLAEVVETVRKVAQKVEEEYGACSVTTNLGLYQESKHMHWHVTYRGESEDEIVAMYGHHDV